QPQLPHEPLDRAAGDPDPLAVELRPDLVGAIDLPVRVPHPPDLRLEDLVPLSARRDGPPDGGVVAARSDLQHAADRLDSPADPVRINALHRGGQRGSSSRAKKADAALRISLARRSSRTSRSRSRIRSRSALVMPGRWPWSTSSRRTHNRSVSGVIPSFPAIDWIAAHSDGCSGRGSRPHRIARSRSSGGYRVTFFMAPSSQRVEPPRYPGRFRLMRSPDREPARYASTGLGAAGERLLASFWQVGREITPSERVDRVA